MSKKRRLISCLLTVCMLLALLPAAAVSAGAADTAPETEMAPYFTVEFTYGEKTYELPGKGSADLSDILAELGLTGEITAAAFSDPALLSVKQEDGAWTVTSLGPFDTTEQLWITVDGIDYELTVTDGLSRLYYIRADGVEDYVTGWYCIEQSDGDNGKFTINDDPFTSWYGVEDNVVIHHRLKVKGDVKLVLKDGSSLTVEGGIHLSTGSLTIYAQKNGTGKLIANGWTSQYNYDQNAAGIGGNYSEPCGALTINGGIITATGGYDCAGIGGEYGSITINGGNITATGGDRAYLGPERGTGGSGIGCTSIKYHCTVSIRGGTVTATGIYQPGIGGDVTISGGTVTATGGVGCPGIGGKDRTVTITGGSVTSIDGPPQISTPSASPFADVPKDSYYYSPVMWAVANGVAEGTGEDTFGPDEPCTRAQMVTFLWRVSGSPEPTGSEMPFTDLVENAFYEKAVLYENGITLGVGGGKFDPDGTVTRGQTVTFLYRMLNGKPGTENPFTDVKEGAFYYDAVLWAYGNGITKGTGPETFSPDDACLRAQIVTFLYRAFNQE